MNLELLNHYNPLLAEILFFVLLFLSGKLLSLALVKTADEAKAKPTTFYRDRNNSLRRLLQAFIVLALSVLSLYLPSLAPGLQRLLPITDQHLYSWLEFWSVVFAITLLEWLVKNVFALLGKRFPVPELLLSIMRLLLFIAIGFIILRFGLSWDISFLLTSTAVITAAIGFALRGVIGDLLSGMSLHLVRSVVPTDWIAVGEHEGEVIATNWRETRLRTVRGHVIVIPNSIIASETFHNMSWPTPTRRHALQITVAFAHPPGQVMEALTEATHDVPQILRSPATPDPDVLVKEYKEYGIVYELRFWTHQYFNRNPIESRVSRMIWYQFDRRGIEIPFPFGNRAMRELLALSQHLRDLQPDLDRDTQRNIEDLRRNEFFGRFLSDAQDDASPVDPAALFAIGKTMRRLRFTRGEVLFRQGEPGKSCYLITQGQVRGQVTYSDTQESFSFSHGRNTLIGEMSLMTGQPRTATVLADSELEVLELSGETLRHILLLREDIPQQLQALISARAEQNMAMYEKYHGEEHKRMMKKLNSERILKRLLRIAGLNA